MKVQRSKSQVINHYTIVPWWQNVWSMFEAKHRWTRKTLAPLLRGWYQPQVALQTDSARTSGIPIVFVNDADTYFLSGRYKRLHPWVPLSVYVVHD